MAMSKTGYTDAIKSTMSEKVNLNANGTIAQPGEAVGAVKRMSINFANAGNSLETNHNIMKAFLDFAQGTSERLSNRVQVTWEVW